MNRSSRIALLPVLLAFAQTAASAENGEKYRKILDARAPLVVTVKLVLRTQSSLGGRVRESNRETLGVVVDSSGLVMLSSSHLGGTRSVTTRGGVIETRSVASNIRVIFGNEVEEYEAVLAAKDSKSGLGFVQIQSLKGRKITALSLADAPEPVIGQEIVCVLRLGRGFDFAPCFGIGRICGAVKTPRKMWAVTGSFIGIGLPVFDAGGRPIGVVTRQEGAGSRSRRAGVFVLPAGKVAAIVDQALKKAREALEASGTKKEEEAEVEPEKKRDPEEEVDETGVPEKKGA
jgi:hypothetical protein